MIQRLIISGMLLMTLQPVLAQNDVDRRYHWRRFVIDAEPPVGFSTSLAFGPAGHPAIAYRRAGTESSRGVRLAEFTGSAWQISEVDPEGQGRVELAYDFNGQAHVLYHAVDGVELRHASRQNGVWVSELVDDGLRDNRYYAIDIAADAQGVLHMVYARHIPEFSIESMTYARFENGSYQNNIRIEDSFTGKWAALTLDAKGLPHTAYFNFGGDLHYAAWNGSSWDTEAIDSTGFGELQGYFASIVHGPSGKFYISFQNQTARTLRLAEGTSRDWQVQDVTKLIGWEEFSTTNPVTLDADESPHIAWFDVGSATLQLSYRQQDQWQTEPIDVVANTGEWVSIAAQPDGLPAVSYYDGNAKVLRYAFAGLTPPLDTDGDAIPDYIEIAVGGNPFDADSDDDGLSDGEEDTNFSGSRERGETDPNVADTDGDGLPDGLELGRERGIPMRGNIAGTNPIIFKGDLDPDTTTDPLQADTDGDGATDGLEDENVNGRVDGEEPDPNNPDTDRDGLNDFIEITAGSSPIDIDSDDDGLEDLLEDRNSNGRRDRGETSPGVADSDGDGLADGLESGVTRPVADPDGDGRLRGTDRRAFRSDSDPGANSDPTKWDSDGDGLSDGEEDRDGNGAISSGETHFLLRDTDDDGLDDGDELVFGSDPLDRESTFALPLKLNADFSLLDQNLWRIIDLGGREAPSEWDVFEDALTQTSNIWDGPDFPGAGVANQPGTLIYLSGLNVSALKLTLKMRPNDDDEAGILFRFQDEENYYRFSLDSEQGYRRFIRRVGGSSQVVTSQPYQYVPGQEYEIKIFAIADRLIMHFDGERVFDLVDSTLVNGSIGFFTWRQAGVAFWDVALAADGSFMPTQNRARIERFDARREAAGAQLSWQLASRNALREWRLLRRDADGELTLLQSRRASLAHELPLNGEFLDTRNEDARNYSLQLLDGLGQLVDFNETAAPNALPEQFSLEASFPNPFIVAHQLRVQAPEAADYVLEIYDVLGRLVALQRYAAQQRGEVLLRWQPGTDNGDRFPAGVYFLRLTARKPGPSNQVLWRQSRKILRVQ